MRRGAVSAAPGPRPPHRPSSGRAPPAPEGSGESPPPPPSSSPPSFPRSLRAVFEASAPPPQRRWSAGAPRTSRCPQPRGGRCAGAVGALQSPAAFVMRGSARKRSLPLRLPETAFKRSPGQGEAPRRCGSGRHRRRAALWAEGGEPGRELARGERAPKAPRSQQPDLGNPAVNRPQHRQKAPGPTRVPPNN